MNYEDEERFRREAEELLAKVEKHTATTADIEIFGFNWLKVDEARKLLENPRAVLRGIVEGR